MVQYIQKLSALEALLYIDQSTRTFQNEPGGHARRESQPSQSEAPLVQTLMTAFPSLSIQARYIPPQL